MVCKKLMCPQSGPLPTRVIVALMLLPCWVLMQDVHANFEQGDKALMLHSQGLGQELDGQFDVALALMRQASQLAPKDRLIVFDLARLAWQRQSPTLEQDSAAFLALQPQDDAETLLQAYILAALGQRRESQVMLQKITQTSPDLAREVLLLQQSMEKALPNSSPESESPSPPSMLRPWGRLYTEVDTNVTILPDSVSLLQSDNNKRQLAFRLHADVGLSVKPWTGKHGLQIDGQFRSGTHINARKAFAPYDTELLAAQISLHTEQGPMLLTGAFLANQLYTNLFQHRFLGQLGGQASAMFNHTSWRLGPYVQAAWRDFAFNNKEGSDFDRDGWAGEAGLGFNWQERWFSAMARVGAQTEMGAGRELRQAGASFAALFHLEWQAFRLGAHLSLQDRIFWQQANQRRDSRLIPSIRFSAKLWQTPLLANVAYSYTGNFSNNSIFSYNRHIASCGLEAPW